MKENGQDRTDGHKRKEGYKKKDGPGRRIAVFAGTYEGHRLAEELEAVLQKEAENGSGLQVFVLVATPYGQKVLSGLKNVRIVCGRKDRAQMEAFLKEKDIRFVVDATHPFAREASVNIRQACAGAGCLYERLLREETWTEEELREKTLAGKVIVAEDIPEAVSILSVQKGRIFVTTGSKEAACYRGIPDYQSRVVLRVLPGEEIREGLLSLGFLPGQILQAEGPFDQAANEAALQEYAASFLVTKDSGAHSGTREKLLAAEHLGVTVVLIRRKREEGRSGSEMRELLWEYIEDGETGTV